jgi:4-amino-4-deoxy-L-arabinose transferase-like glycosyltransferase
MTIDSKAAKRHTVMVLSAALLLRALVAWTVMTQYAPEWLFTRGVEMTLLAKSLLAGQGLSSPFGVPTGPTAFIAPAYPVLVAAVFKIFGVESRAAEFVVLTAQTALNLATIALMMHVARKLFSERAAVLAGLVWACSPPLLWLPTIFWETSFSACMLMGLLALALHWTERPTRWMWPLLGASCGVIALMNPALLLSALAITAWVWFRVRRTAGWQPWIAVLVFVVVFSPWPVRNARVFHAFIPLRTTVGFELWMGNRPGATGYLDESVFPMYNPQELHEYVQRGELGYTAWKEELAHEYIAEHPAVFVRMTAVRAVRFWSGTGTQHGSFIFELHALATTLFGFAGVWLLRRRRTLALLFATPMLLFPLPYYLTHAEFRYRIVIDPLMTVVAAYAVCELYRMHVVCNAKTAEAAQ